MYTLELLYKLCMHYNCCTNYVYIRIVVQTMYAFDNLLADVYDKMLSLLLQHQYFEN